MPGVGEDTADRPVYLRPEYDVLKQRVDLDIDLASRSLKGSTEITIQPLEKGLSTIRLHCRQCRPTLVQIGGIAAKWEYQDPYRRSRMPDNSNVHQHDMLRTKIKTSLQPAPEPELVITLPPRLKIQELRVDPTTALPLYSETPSLQKQENDAMAIVETPLTQNNQLQVPQFATIKLTIEFEVESFRDGLHWIGCDGEDKRYPHFYTKLEPLPGNTSSIFPCSDSPTSRCLWEIAIRCPRTLGDAFRRGKVEPAQTAGAINGATHEDIEIVNGVDSVPKPNGTSSQAHDQYLIELSEDDAALELAVLCIGELSDDVVDPEDESRHTITFNLNDAITARHVALAIGPFEHIDLSMFRATEEEEKLGQTAVKVDGYCLPGRNEEVENTCFPLCQAIDLMGVNYGRFPFTSYQVLFVDDLIHDTVGAAGFSICSTRLLFPQDIIEPLDENTRILVRAVADQWSGVNIIPKELNDTWVITGIAGYMTDVFMKKLAGNNEYRWKQKLAAEKIYELDVDRPSIHQLGSLLHLDSSIRSFLNLKSALVLGILDRRLVKSSGSTGVMRIISKIFLNATTGSLSNGELSTQDFQRTCERLGHNKLESFFRQWVMGAGCPIFYVTQRFNKKKLMVELKIFQKQLDRVTKPPFEPSNFMREVKEHVQEVWAPEPQNLFTGPMTIRIHEADGTPYEHIVEIKETVTTLDIPYNTKYKRLKRSKRQKERAIAENQANGEGGDDSLLYCLGDILDAPEDVQDWKLADWSKEDEEKMGQESYEWIRLDADFEWIGKMHLVMPLYMYISQLQQDRDIVAQYESMRYLLGSNPHHVSLSILLRTLMDSRYFHGIRVMAADGLALMAKDKLREIGQHHLEKAFSEMFCDAGSIMPRPNDFSSRVNFIIQCAIPKAMAKLRDEDGKVPEGVQKFFVDKLRFNDNSDNEFSDVHYVATLMRCLTDSLVASHREVQPTYHFSFGEDEPMEPENPNAEFEAAAVNEIERYRRIDEWITTYQNVYSTTAIECLQKLTKAGIVKDKTKELMLYTAASTADNVRLQAFRCLNEIGLARNPALLKHLLHSLVHDCSPYLRDRLLGIFGEALGHIALGENEAERAPPPQQSDGLIVEQEIDTEARHLEVTRKTTPEGAILALRITLQDDLVVRKALWYAATSPDLALEEIAAFCDIAALMFDPVTSYAVQLKLPRPYKVKHLGHGKLRFYQHGGHRLTPVIGLGLEEWQWMEALGLHYSGKLADETTSFIQERDRTEQKRAAAESLRLQIELKKQEIASVQSSVQYTPTDMLPPPVPLATPTVERTGFKLSLGAKRKASVDLSSVQSREGSPKASKINKASTPGGLAIKPPAKQRQSSTPSTKPSTPRYSLITALPVRPSIAQRVQDILSRPPNNSALLLPSTQPSRSITPVLPQSATSFSPPSSLLQPSPPAQANSLFSPPPPSLTSVGSKQSMNLGAFRSYGEPSRSTSFTASPSEVKQEPNGLTSFSGSNSSPQLLTQHPSSLTSISPPALTAPNGIATANANATATVEADIPLAKPKLVLKFTKNPASASPPE